MSLLKPRKPAKATAQAPAPASAPAFEERLLRLADVCPMVGLGKTSIYDLMKKGRFPVRIKFSARAAMWPESAVMAWIQATAAQAQATQPGGVQ